MVFITQLLCPQRHCILAAAWVPGDLTAEEIEQGVQAIVNAGPTILGAVSINPWCGLCGATQLKCETKATSFETLDEANASLRACEEAQLLTSSVFAQMPKPN